MALACKMSFEALGALWLFQELLEKRVNQLLALKYPLLFDMP